MYCDINGIFSPDRGGIACLTLELGVCFLDSPKSGNRIAAAQRRLLSSDPMITLDLPVDLQTRTESKD